MKSSLDSKISEIPCSNLDFNQCDPIFVENSRMNIEYNVSAQAEKMGQLGDADPTDNWLKCFYSEKEQSSQEVNSNANRNYEQYQLNSSVKTNRNNLHRSMSMSNLKRGKMRSTNLIQRICEDSNVNDPLQLCYDDIAMPPKSTYNGYQNNYNGEIGDNKKFLHYREDKLLKEFLNTPPSSPYSKSIKEDKQTRPSSITSTTDRSSNGSVGKSPENCHLEENINIKPDIDLDRDIINSTSQPLSPKISDHELVDSLLNSKANVNENYTVINNKDLSEDAEGQQTNDLKKFTHHPYFSLLRDLSTACNYFDSPTLPAELLFNLPSDVNMLLYNFCVRNKYKYPVQTKNPIEDEKIFQTISSIHSTLIKKINKAIQQHHQPSNLHQFRAISSPNLNNLNNQFLRQNYYTTNNSQNGHQVNCLPTPFIHQNQTNEAASMSSNFNQISSPVSLSSPNPYLTNSPTFNQNHYSNSYNRAYQSYYSPISVQNQRYTGSSQSFAISKKSSFPKEASQILLGWLQKNRSNPYPSDGEKDDLRQQTGLTMVQINNWFTNARRRVLKRWKDCNSSKKSSKSAEKYCKY